MTTHQPSKISNTEAAPVARVLYPEEILYFPATYREQSYLAGILACRKAVRREQAMRCVGGAALELAAKESELAEATQGFQLMVGVAIDGLGVRKGVISQSFRAKEVITSPGELTRIEQKVIVYNYKAAQKGIQPQILPDMLAGEIILDTKDPGEADSLVLDLQREWSLPDVYPGDFPVVEIGASENPNSAPIYPYRKIIVPIRYGDKEHTAELRVLNQAEKQYDTETRPAYVERRMVEFEEASRYVTTRQIECY